MKQKESPTTFEVRIEGHNNSTWQGTLITGGQIITFKSDLELLRAMDELLCEKNDVSYLWNT